MDYILIFVSSILLTTQSEEWEYNTGPLNFQAARLDCIAKGGDLATIITDEDRIKASEAIGSNEAPWSGLYSNNEAGWWVFFDETICTDTTSGRCVSFWKWIGDNGVNQPRCLDKGYGCALYYGDDGYDNDKDCHSPAPYLCKGITTTPHTSYTGNYIAVKERYYWADAQKQCKIRFGTDLATILTDADYAAADAALKAVDAIAGGYMGLNDRTTEGKYQWVDGTPCTENDNKCTDLWREGQPNNVMDPKGERYLEPDADCTVIWPHYGYGFSYEFHCTQYAIYAFICNRPDNIPAKQVIEAQQFNDGSDGVTTIGLLSKDGRKGLMFNIGVAILFVATIVLMVYNCCSCGTTKKSNVYINSKV